jgi:NAD(P)-dependent dehydrogenase (short-subunit alcohol dehydrogenase family)
MNTTDSERGADRALTGQTVVVSGGSSGLGAALVDAFLRRGARPRVVDLVPPKHDVPYALADLSDRASVPEAIADLIDGQPVRAVVTAAGTDACGPFAGTEADRWERVVAVNLLGTAAVIRGVLPQLQPHGDIVTIASTLGWRVLSDASAYCASKFGVVGFTRALARELDGSHRVTLVVPGGMATAFFDGRPDQYRPGPDAVLADPNDVADMIVHAVALPYQIEVKELVIGPPGEPSWP